MNALNENHDTHQLKRLFRAALSRWYWFVISLAVCVGVVAVYIFSVAPAYTRFATVKLDEDKAASRLGSIPMTNSPIIQQSGLLGGMNNVNNEIVVFQSPRLMREAIDRLGLRTGYRCREGKYVTELYRRTPVAVALPDVSDRQKVRFRMKIVSGSEVELSGFRLDEKRLKSGKIRVPLSDTVPTPIGRVALQPTYSFSPEYIGKTIRVRHASMPDAVEFFLKELSVALAARQTSMVDLRVSDASPERGEDLLTALIAVYGEDAIAHKQREASRISGFIGERLTDLERELGAVEEGIEQYKSRNLLVDPRLSAGRDVTESSTYDALKFELRNRVESARFLRGYLTDPAKKDLLLPVPAAEVDMDIGEQTAYYNTMLLKRDQLSANSSARNPRVIELSQSLEAIRGTILVAVDNLIATAGLQLGNLEQKEREIAGRISSSPVQERHLVQVAREQKIKESLFIYLLQKREENELQSAVASADTRIITPPTGRIKPTAPNKPLLLIVALLAGLLIPALAVWMREGAGRR